VKKHGGAATLFAKNGDQYVRVATTVKKEDGTSAIGTALDTNSPAIACSTMVSRTTRVTGFCFDLAIPASQKNAVPLA
jgi:hypothetical protein